jgi:hypothetical protein
MADGKLMKWKATTSVTSAKLIGITDKGADMPTKTTRQRDKLIEAAQQSYTFEVVGSGEFPVDMLRYDLCWPSSEQDSGLTAEAAGDHVRFKRTRYITLRGLKTPTVARWASFGWTVTEPENF